MAPRRRITRRRGVDVAPKLEDDDVDLDEDDDDDDGDTSDDIANLYGGTSDDDDGDNTEDDGDIYNGIDEESQRENQIFDRVVASKVRGKKNVRWAGNDMQKYNYCAATALKTDPGGAVVTLLKYPSMNHVDVIPVTEVETWEKLFHRVKEAYWNGEAEVFQWRMMIHGRRQLATDKLRFEENPSRIAERKTQIGDDSMRRPPNNDHPQGFSPQQFQDPNSHNQPMPQHGQPHPGYPYGTSGFPMYPPGQYPPGYLPPNAWSQQQPQSPPHPEVQPEGFKRRGRRRDDDDDEIDELRSQISRLESMLRPQTQPQHGYPYPPPGYGYYPSFEQERQKLAELTDKLEQRARALEQAEENFMMRRSVPQDPMQPHFQEQPQFQGQFQEQPPQPFQGQPPYQPQDQLSRQDVEEIVSRVISSSRPTEIDSMRSSIRTVRSLVGDFSNLRQALTGEQQPQQPPQQPQYPPYQQYPQPPPQQPPTQQPPSQAPVEPFKIYDMGGIRCVFDSKTGKPVDAVTSFFFNLDNIGSILKPFGEKLGELTKEIRSHNQTEELQQKLGVVKQAHNNVLEELQSERRNIRLLEERIQDLNNAINRPVNPNAAQAARDATPDQLIHYEGGLPAPPPPPPPPPTPPAAPPPPQGPIADMSNLPQVPGVVQLRKPDSAPQIDEDDEPRGLDFGQ